MTLIRVGLDTSSLNLVVVMDWYSLLVFDR
jgi:hypothetical protein